MYADLAIAWNCSAVAFKSIFNSTNYDWMVSVQAIDVFVSVVNQYARSRSHAVYGEGTYRPNTMQHFGHFTPHT